MKNIFLLLITGSFLNLPAFSQVDLEKISVLDNKLELAVPKGFTSVTNDSLSKKLQVGSYDADWAITGEAGKTYLGFAYTEEIVDDNGIPAFTDKLLADVKAGSKEFRLLGDGILMKDGKNIGYIKYISQVKGQKTFNYMFYISLEGRLVLFSFWCPKKLRKTWEHKAEEIAASLRLLI